MHRPLLKFKDLARYGIHNWPTLRRWQDRLGAPIGFMNGVNSRVWFEDEWEAWIAARAEAPPKRKPASSVGAGEGGPVDALECPSKSKSTLAAEPVNAQPINGGGAHG
jgi:hypothetical protein